MQKPVLFSVGIKTLIGGVRPLIKVANLCRSFDTKKAVADLNFEVRRGEIFALLGPNGAGKTTTIKMILGMLKPDSGSISFDGQPLQFGEVAYKSRIGYVPETCALYETLSGREYLSFIGNLHHLSETDVKEKSDRLLEMLDLGDEADQLIRSYSKGMKQKVLIISALLHDPDLIILDEPFSGLDANTVLIFKEILKSQAARGKTIIFCSHILEVVQKLVDRLMIMKEGKALVSGTPDEIMRQTGHDSLDLTFNRITGSRDTEAVAQDIIDVIGSSKDSDSGNPDSPSDNGTN